MSVNGIEITEVSVHPIKNPEPGSHLQAFAKVVLNGQFCINSIRVLKGKFGPFVAFPGTYDKKEGKSFPHCHPITKALQEYLSERILRHWQETAVA